MILLVIPQFKHASPANTAKNLLRGAVLAQYIPRLWRFLPMLAGQSPTGFIFESAWANFIMNLLTFILSGHVVGSCWYLFGLQVGKCITSMFVIAFLVFSYFPFSCLFIWRMTLIMQPGFHLPGSFAIRKYLSFVFSCILMTYSVIITQFVK